MWNFLTDKDLYRAGLWALPPGLAMERDKRGGVVFDEEGLANRDRQLCRLCSRAWDLRRWGRYAPDGWERGMCVTCRLIIEEYFV